MKNIEVGVSFKNLDEILKYKNDHWNIAKVINKNSNYIEISIIDSEKIVNLDIEKPLWARESLTKYLFKYERLFLCH